MNSIKANPFFKHFTISDGLPSNEVYYVYQDKTGYIWLSTDRGVSQYDGVRFKNYGLEDGLCSNIAFGCKEDERGMIWFYSFSGELSMFDPLTETFTCPTFNRSLSEKLNGQVINDISFYNDTIYVMIQNSYFKIFQSEKLYEIQEYEFDSNAITIIELPNHQLVYGANKSGITTSPQIVLYSENRKQEFKCTVTSINNIKNRIKALKRESVHLVLGSNYYRINKHGRLNEMALDFKCTPGIEVFGDTGVMVGTYGRGIQYCGFSSNANDTFDVNTAFIDHLNISCVIRDKQGGMWGSSQEYGLFYFPDPGIKSFLLNSDFTTDKVTCLTTDSINVFYGTYDGVVGSISVENNNWYRKELYSTETDVKYIFLYENQLFYNEGSNFIRHQIESNLTWKEQNTDLTSIKVAKASNKNNILEVYFPFNPLDRKIISDRWSYGRIRDFCFSGNSLYCSNLNTLFYMDVKIGNPQKVLKSSKEIIDFDISHIARYKGDTVLVTSKVHGLFLVYKNEIIRNLTKSDGLSSNCLLTVYYEPGSSVIWVGSDKGLDQIQRFGKSSEEIISLTGKLGIPSRPITKILSFKKSLILGAENDILIIHPSSLNRKWDVQRLELNRCFINGVKSNTVKGILELVSGQNNIRFEYSNFNYRWMDNLIFRSRLYSENDTTWNVSKEAVSTYSSVKPGTYLFQIEDLNPAGYWQNDNRLEIPIVIKPPFWQTWWFRVILLLLIIAGLWLYLRYAIKKAQKQNLLKLALSESKFMALGSQLNPHFVFGIMNSISAGLYKMEPGTAISYIGKLSKLMRQVFKNSQSSLITVQEEADAVRKYLDLEYIRTNGRFNYSIDFQKEEEVKQLYIPSLIIQPFVENSIKYGFNEKEIGSWIQLNFYIDETNLIVEIKDNGRGIDSTKTELRINKEKHSIDLIKDRLELLEKIYEKGIDLSVNDLANQGKSGTLVIIRLPLIYKKEELGYLNYV